MSSEENSLDENNASSSGASSSSHGLTVEALQRYLAEKLGFLDSDKEPSKKVKVLDDVSIDGLVNYLKSDKCKNIITLAGAGISTSAGIPDFRSPGTGLYHNLQEYNLPNPQAVFELAFFEDNPKPFFVLAKNLYPGSFKPTLSHYFIRLLDEKGYLRRHYTQNIDTLERVAGIPEEKLVEAHGTFYTGHCMQCKEEYQLEWMKNEIFADKVPICEKCPGVVKPDIVFFGENLPDKFHRLMKKDFDECDLLIIMGSSLVVQPFASLVDRAPPTCPRLLINKEKAGQRSGLMALMGIGEGLDFDSADNSRDVAWIGDCDDGCRMLAEKLGWENELRKLFEDEHKKIDDTEKKDVEHKKEFKDIDKKKELKGIDKKEKTDIGQKESKKEDIEQKEEKNIKEEDDTKKSDTAKATEKELTK